MTEQQVQARFQQRRIQPGCAGVSAGYHLYLRGNRYKGPAKEARPYALPAYPR